MEVEILSLVVHTSNTPLACAWVFVVFTKKQSPTICDATDVFSTQCVTLFLASTAYTEAEPVRDYDQTMYDPMMPDNLAVGAGPYAYYSPYESPYTMESPETPDDFTNPAAVSRDTILDNDDDISTAIYGYDRNLLGDNSGGHLPTLENKRAATELQGQRVQVTTEETGSQRVQVNNGFQEAFVPGLNPESGRISSGVLLEWKLTFHGTGSEDSLSGDIGDDLGDDNDISSDTDLDL